MPTYVIGDIQGCFDELQRLLDTINFDTRTDTLWFTGDLVNRGPKSLEVLRFVSGLGDRAVTVLGNHDLHLLAKAHGARQGKKDTLDAILSAPDRDELLHWLRMQPLLFHDPSSGFTLVHAGLPPQWDLAQARAAAREVQAVLRGPDYTTFFDHMYGNEPDHWSEQLTGWSRKRFITNAFTRLRYCHADGRLDLIRNGSPDDISDDDLQPWFRLPQRRSKGMKILFGHWSTLHLTADYQQRHGIFHLDTGCLWGGKLTALRLEDLHHISIPCDPL